MNLFSSAAGAWIAEAYAHRTAWEADQLEDNPEWLDLVWRHERGEVG